MRDVNNVTGGLLRDTLGGRIADRKARTAVSEIRALHRGVKVAEEVGENKCVLDIGSDPGTTSDDRELDRREAELEEKLAAIRERRRRS